LSAAGGQRKRFIAGAVCPKCGVEDRIYVLVAADGQSRHCNDCDFSESLEDLPEPASAEPVGAWEPVKLLK
jgi:uncharacterized metal-binding protein (TIGR02443 family)